ncbi:unnamed protein product [Peronospora farinosa]|uniref:BZIP domain-containing protein n=1 Tax=Peronospora farinosa TaxID=134698 RepID=A0AAV0T530_9STRA|nr:unnamed protein product [Peronospora farinosa]
MDDFFSMETDAFALHLLDWFGSDDILLKSPELDRSHTHLQQTQFPVTVSHCPTSPVSTDDDTTDAEVLTPPPAFQQHLLCSLPKEVDMMSFLAAKVLLLGSSMLTHSPLSSGQKLLSPRTHKVIDKSSSNNNNSSVTSTPIDAANSMQSIDKTQPMPVSKPLSDALSYALPVAYFAPSFNVNQKRPITPVLPGATSLSTCNSSLSSATTAAAATNDSYAIKSKREIRQMKNRESANKSRLRRKAQLTNLTARVAEFKTKEKEMLIIIAGLRAENKSLLDQNMFLRSLVTSCKQEHASSHSDHQLAAFVSLPDQSCVALNMLESVQNMDVDDESQAADLAVMTPQPDKRRTMASTLSMASVAVCASVFGITVFVDCDGTAVDAGNVRGVGRVLHEAPTPCGIEECSFEASMSPLRFVATMMGSWGQLVSSSILWQSHSAGFAVLPKSGRRHAQQ